MTTEEAVIIQECEARCNECQFSRNCGTQDEIYRNIAMSLVMEDK